MRVLGIDPGLTRCGWGVVDGTVGRPPQLIDAGVIRTAAELPTAERLAVLSAAVTALIRQHRPEAVAVERVFAQHNLRTVMGTAQASGVVMAAAGLAEIPVALHTPSEVKAAVTGHGNAGKPQVGLMVARLLRLPGPPSPADTADALALAICHLWRGGGQRRLAAAGTR